MPIEFKSARQEAREATGGKDAEKESAAELTEVQKGFRERRAQEEARFIQATDSEYWVALCFANREQKEEFLAKAKVQALGDKYLDGFAFADALGIKLKPCGFQRRPARLDNRLADLVQEKQP